MKAIYLCVFSFLFFLFSLGVLHLDRAAPLYGFDICSPCPVFLGPMKGLSLSSLALVWIGASDLSPSLVIYNWELWKMTETEHLPIVVFGVLFFCVCFF